MSTKQRKSIEQTEQLGLKVRGVADTSGAKWVKVSYKGRHALLDYGAFAVGGNIWSTLHGQGVTIVSRHDKADLIARVEALEKFTDRVVFSRPGWCHGQFATVSGRVFAPPGEKTGLVGFTPSPSKCASSGTQAEWLQRVAEPLVGHHVPCFFLMAVFAAPMLAIVGRTDNFGFELVGEGGRGKSTTQRLMASVVGPAMQKDAGYITTFNTTANGLERSMPLHSDMPFIIDEANLFASDGGRDDDRKMRDFSFQMASGTTKGRFDTPQQEGYRFIYMTSANVPFHELLKSTGRDTADAASDRLLSIVIPKGDAGVFGELPEGVSSYGQFTRALESGMRDNYGTAMPRFLRQLVKGRHEDEQGLAAKVQARIDRFKRNVGVNDNNGSDARVAEAFGLVYAAGLLARRYGVLPRSLDCLAAATHCYMMFRSTVPVRQSFVERLLTIAARPETMRIDRKALPTLTDEEMEAARAFVREVKGETLLLMTTEFYARMFPDGGALSHTAEFLHHNKTDKGARGGGYHCRVRENAGSEWFYAFRLPEADPAEE